MEEKRISWLDHWALPGLLLAVSLGGIVLYLFHLKGATGWGVTFDDAWIHFTLARNLAETGAMGINPGQWSGGNSSLLWGLLLAGCHRFVGSDLGPALVLGAVSHALTAGLLYEIARRSLGRMGGLLCGILCAFCGPLLFLGLSGMETAFFMMLGLAALWTWMGRQPYLSGFFLFLVLMTRLEALVLWGLLLLHDLIWGRRTMPPRTGLSLFFSGPLAFLFSGLLHLRMEGQFFPLTMTGRRWLWQVAPSSIPFWPSNWEPIGDYYELWNVYFWDWLLQSFRLERLPALMWLYRALWAALLLGGAFWLGRLAWRARGRAGQWAGAIVVLWAAGHFLVYPFSLPVATLRHQVGVFAALFLLMAAGLEGLRWLLQSMLGRRWSAARRCLWGLWGVLAVLLLFWNGVTFQQWRVNYADHVRHINEIHVRLAHWVDKNLPPDAVVAAYDIGAISYFGRREIVDLGGLTDPALLPYLYAGNVVPYLRAHRVTHLAMIIGPTGDHWWGRLGLAPPAQGRDFTVEELRVFKIDPYVSPPFNRPVDYVFYPASRSIGVYAISWSAAGSADVQQPRP